MLRTAHQDSSRARDPWADSIGRLRWLRWACGSIEAVEASSSIDAASSRRRVCSRRIARSPASSPARARTSRRTRVAAGRGDLQALAGGGDVDLQLVEAGLDLLAPARQELTLDGRAGGHLGQPRPPDRPRPRGAHRAVTLVARPGRSALAAEAVAGVVSPQPAVPADPSGVLVDDLRVPRIALARADRPPVATGVVDVGDPHVLGPGGPRREHPGHPPADPQEPGLGRRLDRDQVVTGQVGPRMRTGAGEHHGVPAVDEGQVRVVPAAAQVVAGLVVRGEHHPPGAGRPASSSSPVPSRKIGDLLPVGLVLVDPAERRAPVVERVEEPVLADRASRRRGPRGRSTRAGRARGAPAGAGRTSLRSRRARFHGRPATAGSTRRSAGRAARLRPTGSPRSAAAAGPCAGCGPCPTSHRS